jgi:hypothetical protein
LKLPTSCDKVASPSETFPKNVPGSYVKPAELANSTVEHAFFCKGQKKGKNMCK